MRANPTQPLLDLGCSSLSKSTPTSKPPRVIFQVVRTLEVLEYSPEIAMNWFMRKLADDVALQQAFMNSACFPGILSFIDWAGIRGYLKEKPSGAADVYEVRAMSEEEMEAEGEGCLAVTAPEPLWKAAIAWGCVREDRSLKWIRQYSECSWGITYFIAWCLEHGYLEQEEEAQ